MDPDAIAYWATEFRAATKGPFQMNLWAPDPVQIRGADHGRSVLDVLEGWGPRPTDLSGGIADARDIVAALALGASAVQLGTASLRTPEAAIAPAWADALARTQPEDTAITRAFSGRPGRSLRTSYVTATERANTMTPLPYPL